LIDLLAAVLDSVTTDTGIVATTDATTIRPNGAITNIIAAEASVVAATHSTFVCHRGSPYNVVAV
jgi:hypothetical protein